MATATVAPQAGYAVIFLTRKFSIQPFSLDLASQDPLEACMHLFGCDAASASTCTSAAASGGGAGASPQVSPSIDTHSAAYRAAAAAVAAAASVRASGMLLTVPFTTLFEYMAYLRAIALSVAPFGRQVAFYLAAAVSDFYIPWRQLAEHKIQSDDGPLTLNLQRVPKMLGALRASWAPASFVVRAAVPLYVRPAVRGCTLPMP